MENETLFEEVNWDDIFEEEIVQATSVNFQPECVNTFPTDRSDERFPTLSFEEMEKILEEKHSKKTKQVTNWSIATFKGKERIMYYSIA